MTAPQICGHRWYGPRRDVPDAYANHVCILKPKFKHWKHRCVCGAEVHSLPVGKDDDEHHPDP